MSEPRAIWLVLHGDDPVRFAWALFETQEEATLEAVRERVPGWRPPDMLPPSKQDAQRRSWAAALSVREPPAEGWRAVPTTWTRVPRRLQDALRPDRGAEWEIDAVRVGGTRWWLQGPVDERGEPVGEAAA